MWYFKLAFDDSLVLLCLILSCHGTLFFSQISNWLFCDIFKHKCFEAVKEIHELQFRLTTTRADDKLLLPKPIKYWRTDQYQESADCVEVDLDSDINCLFSSNLMQSTTLPSQCEVLPCIWMWRLLYFDYWYHFAKRPDIVFLSRESNSHYNKGAPEDEFFKWKHNTQ